MFNSSTGKKILSTMIAIAMTMSIGGAALAAGEGGTPPDKPDGEMGGTPPDMPGGGGPGGAPGGGSSGVDSYDAVIEYSTDTEVSGESYTSTGTDENAILVSGGEIQLTDITIDRTSEDSSGGDSSSFYGVGAAILATDGTAYISGADITTDSKGGAGAFAYGDGVIYIADSTINTTQSTSGGIHAAGGGTVYAYDVTATTQGGSSAAIRSDRGGGLMVVDGGSYTSNGSGSPAIYCTAEIAVNDAALTATNSEAICIEGLNSLYLYDSDLTGSMPDDSQNDCTWTVILYQSMSGDSQVGCSTFQMVDGTLTSTNGGLFYTTNTESRFILQNVDITPSEDSEFFLKVTGNSNQRGWGSTGSNGAQSTFTAISQTMDGDVIWDSISTLDMYMTDGSTLTGAFIDDESNAGSGGSGYANLYISADSTWVVTGDSVLTNLYNEGSIVDENGSAVTVKGSDGTVYVNGTSEYTVTVDSYSNTADFSGMDSVTEWSQYETERPEALAVSTAAAVTEEVTEEVTTDTAETEEASEPTVTEEVTTEAAETESNSTVWIIAVIGVLILAALGAGAVIKKSSNTKHQ